MVNAETVAEIFISITTVASKLCRLLCTLEWNEILEIGFSVGAWGFRKGDSAGFLSQVTSKHPRAEQDTCDHANCTHYHTDTKPRPQGIVMRCRIVHVQLSRTDRRNSAKIVDVIIIHVQWPQGLHGGVSCVSFGYVKVIIVFVIKLAS